MADISKIRILNTDYDIKDETARNIIDKQLYSFGTLNEMTSSTLLKNGDFAKTLGFYEINDGGSANYYIRTKTNNEVVNNITLFEITNDLVAELVYDKSNINVKQMGAHGDGETDDLSIINNIINLVESGSVLYFPNGNYIFSNPLNITKTIEIKLKVDKSEHERILNLVKNTAKYKNTVKQIS